ncbi:MAG: hypothetical protein OQL16_10360, partial [Gammaproteobacteria bacterium]|nr:hypothetical protein [Gammaproteobacteria bacterium]
MSFLAVSSIIALLIKLSLFWVGKFALFRENQPLALFLVALCALNISELMSFIYNGNEDFLLINIQAYYATAVLAAAALFYLSMHITHGAIRYVVVCFSLSAIIAVITMGSGLMIAGIEPIGYSFTRVPGQFFFILQIYLIATLLLSIGILLLGAVKSADRMINKRSLVILISVVPLVFFTVLITITLSLGIKINGAVIISMMTSLMLVILIYCEKHYRLFKFLSYVPYTHEHELRTRAAKLVDQMIED